ncbi:MAG: DNA-3-methyladenine glycosylase I [Alphaproteobacteria bacterium]|nr:DNA-3-methyladenine glycosylase I [Alphaproteobacteria bacterium]
MAESYCEIAKGHPFHGPFHDNEHGFPTRDDAVLFERLCLEINQAGLSWLTVLKKREAFRKAYRGFDLDKVARFGKRDIDRLLGDAGIIRNRRKIEAAIENAKRLCAVRAEHGSFAGWLDGQVPQNLEEWIPVFRKTFVFTGKEIVNEFLTGTGYLPGAHDPECPVYRLVLKEKPPWMRE